MKIFVSSLITGMEPERAAVVGAVRALGHDEVTAETFGARPESPQVACLAGVRESGCVVLVLGGRYGAKQPSGLSATHEEFREARDRRPLLAFVQDGIDREPDQEGFVAEVQKWQGGQFTERFSTADELRDAVTRALHRWELSTAVGAPDAVEMLARATGLLPSDERGFHNGVTTLAVAVVGGPRQSILRPVELEEGPLRRHLHQSGRFGETPIFVDAEGVESAIEAHAFVLSQSNRSVRLDEEGAIRIVLPLSEGRAGITALIEENLRETLVRALRFSSNLLEHIDNVHRLSHVAIAARINGAGGSSWRTRQEHAASPNQGSWNMHTDDRPPTALSPPSRPRAALRQQVDELAEDFTVLFRRQFKSAR